MSDVRVRTYPNPRIMYLCGDVFKVEIQIWE